MIQRIITFEKKKVLREKELMRCGIPRNDIRKDLRICSQHNNEKVIINKIINHGKTTVRKMFELTVPSCQGVASFSAPSKMDNKGLGHDRQKRQMVNLYCQVYKKAKKEDIVRALNSPSSESSSRESSGQSSSDSDTPPKEKINRFSADTIKLKKRLAYHDRDPIVRPLTLSDKEIKRRTGFRNEKDMLVYIFIICNGNMKKLVHTSSALTWYEEWFFFFEMKYGRTCRRWEDAASEEKYGIGVEYLRKLFNEKLIQELTCRNSWPKYLTHDEDVFFMSDEFEERYKGRRIIMWDNTNINIAQPSCADMQRATWSSYYASNVLKGGIFLMLCGWMGAHNLWTGAVSDTRYNGEGEILDAQKKFVASDLVNDQVLPFTNMTETGYCLLLAAW